MLPLKLNYPRMLSQYAEDLLVDFQAFHIRCSNAALNQAVQAASEPITDTKLFSFSATEPVNPSPLQDWGWGNSDRKMESANDEKLALSSTKFKARFKRQG